MERDDDLPLVVGRPVDEAQEMRITLLHCSDCGMEYALPDVIDDEKLMRVCTSCATSRTKR